ncbi:MAG: HAD-IA family hydrolase [Candidatus Woesearchaeota archaeon]|jgi:HAD superfamily hydrolase (TIGR01509 family)
MKTKLVMFDYDGVLANSNHLPKQYYDLLAKKIGSKRFETWEECREYMEVDFTLTLKRLGIVNPDEVKIAHELFKSMNKHWKDLELFPAVKEMLVELKQRGYIIAIVTNNNEESVVYDLKRHDVMKYFDHIIDKKYGYKPATDQIMHCLKITGVKPEEAVMIDDMDGGIIAAKNAKLKKAIGVSYGYQLPYRLHMADVIVEAPEQIMGVIE